MGKIQNTSGCVVLRLQAQGHYDRAKTQNSNLLYTETVVRLTTGIPVTSCKLPHFTRAFADGGLKTNHTWIESS